MGVPSFYRWLAQKYPHIVTDVIETDLAADGSFIPVDLTQPNPNGQEFDNLYLDMNGIIHPCTHPEDSPPPETFDDMMKIIFKYIDRLMSMIRPRKLLFMAIDGVAPRAKMNQQRSRRFRAAKEAREKAELEKKLYDEFVEEGKDPSLLGIDPNKKAFDSNVITPGTPFMDQLAKGLRYYIADRINNNSGWANIKVILSDSNIPGEGEHKIMDFIRRQRIQPGYNPNTSHVLYGLDADLIMLALATHEPHFCILREMVFDKNASNRCRNCGQEGHYADQCTGKPKEKDGEYDLGLFKRKPYQLLHIPVLREYLTFDLQCNTPFPFDPERAIDDWVFLCFFVGNDFLPHLPTLQIREGAIDMLMHLYTKILPSLPGYLTEHGEVYLDRVELVMQEVGALEESILRNRRDREQRAKVNRKRKRENSREFLDLPGIYDTPTPESLEHSVEVRNEAKRFKKNFYSGVHSSEPLYPLGKDKGTVILPEGTDAATPEKSNIRNSGVLETSRTPSPGTPSQDEDETPVQDDLRLGEEGWKERYYNQKFQVGLDDDAFRKTLCRDYVEGLVWVMKYYYQGCVSWKWYFPHHYAPFSSDLVDIATLKFNFELGTPFRPFEQLMGVLPGESARDALPAVCSDLMNSEDSPIIDFYPKEFPIDMEGCRFAWQGVVQLPFIDERRLLEAVKTLDGKFTEDEDRRNSPGTDLLLLHKNHPLVRGQLKNEEALSDPAKRVKLDHELAINLFGEVSQSPYNTNVVLSCIEGLFDILNSAVHCYFFYHPVIEPGYVWKAGLLPNATLPPSRLTQNDLLNKKRPFWIGQAGRRFVNRGTEGARFNDPRHLELAQQNRNGNRGNYRGRGGRGRGRDNYQRDNYGDQRGNRDYQRDNYQDSGDSQRGGRDNYQRDNYGGQNQRDNYQRDNYQSRDSNYSNQRNDYNKRDNSNYQRGNQRGGNVSGHKRNNYQRDNYGDYGGDNRSGQSAPRGNSGYQNQQRTQNFNPYNDPNAGAAYDQGYNPQHAGYNAYQPPPQAPQAYQPQPFQAPYQPPAFYAQGVPPQANAYAPPPAANYSAGYDPQNYGYQNYYNPPQAGAAEYVPAARPPPDPRTNTFHRAPMNFDPYRANQ